MASSSSTVIQLIFDVCAEIAEYYLNVVRGQYNKYQLRARIELVSL